VQQITVAFPDVTRVSINLEKAHPYRIRLGEVLDDGFLRCFSKGHRRIRSDI
jgi:hypothetical protein